MPSLKDLRAEKEKLMAKANEITQNAMKANRDMTAAEASLFARYTDRVKMELNPQIEEVTNRVEASEKALSDLITFGAAEGADGVATKALALTGASGFKAATEIAEHMRDRFEEHGQKAFPSNGVITSRAPLVPEPVELQRVPTSIVDLLRVKVRDAPRWAGIRQTGFTNKASIVPAGAEKPTSEITIENTEGVLSVIAHLSEPVDKFLLEDNNHLIAFIHRNLLWGLKETLEEEILNGDGSEFTVSGVETKHFDGLLHVTGTQKQAYAGDKLVSLRSAMTKLETVGFLPDAFVVNATDWEAIETRRNTSGSFDLGSALNLAERKAWGTRVVTSNRIPAGTGLALDLSSLNIDTDLGGVKIAWDGGGDLFAKNQVRARVEGRFGLTIERPEGIVVVDLDEA